MPGVTIAPEGVYVFWKLSSDSHVVGLRWSPDRRYLVAGGIEGDVGIVDVPTGAFVHRWKAHAFGLSSVALSPTGDRIATCGQDGALRIWRASDAGLVAECRLANRWGIRAEYSPSGHLIGVAAGKTVAFYDSDGSLVREFTASDYTVSDLGWKPPARGCNAETLATSGYGGVHLWRADLDARANRFEWKGSSLVLAWSPDGRYLATGDQDSTVHFWIVAKGKDLEMSGYPIKVKELAWSADSRFLATGGGDVVTVWDCAGRGPRGTRPLALEGHEAKLTAMEFSRGGVLASGSEDGEVRLWRPHADETVRAALSAQSAIGVLAWSSDDALLAIGAANGDVLCVAADLA